jgi:hypothetical protein
MTIKKPASQKAPVKPDEGDLIDRVINAGSPPPPTEVTPVIEEKEIKFQMVISPELCKSIDGARKLSKTSRRAWLLQAAQEKLEREGKML